MLSEIYCFSRKITALINVMTVSMTYWKKCFHKDCVSTIQSYKHSPAIFSRPDWAAVSKQLSDIVPIESIVPNI